MEKIHLNTKGTAKFLAVSTPLAKCTCYTCSICLVCIAFAPIIGVSLSVTLSTALLNTQQPQ